MMTWRDVCTGKQQDNAAAWAAYYQQQGYYGQQQPQPQYQQQQQSPAQPAANTPGMSNSSNKNSWKNEQS